MRSRLDEISSFACWACAAWSAGCLIAAANWFNTWRSFGQVEPPGSFVVIDARARMDHWILWAVVALMLCGAARLVRRRSRAAG